MLPFQLIGLALIIAGVMIGVSYKNTLHLEGRDLNGDWFVYSLEDKYSMMIDDGSSIIIGDEVIDYDIDIEGHVSQVDTTGDATWYYYVLSLDKHKTKRVGKELTVIFRKYPADDKHKHDYLDKKSMLLITPDKDEDKYSGTFTGIAVKGNKSANNATAKYLLFEKDAKIINDSADE